MVFFIQKDKSGYVRDCVQAEHDGYEQVNLDLPLPEGFLGGWWRVESGEPAFDRAKFEEVNEIPRLKQELAEAEARADGSGTDDVAELFGILKGEIE